MDGEVREGREKGGGGGVVRGGDNNGTYTLLLRRAHSRENSRNVRENDGGGRVGDRRGRFDFVGGNNW